MVRRRVLAVGLALALASGWGVVSVSAASRSAGRMEVLATDDLSAYENNEVLVSFADGAIQLLTYEDDQALEAGLAALSQRTDVTVIQPNYTYTGTGLSVSDPLVSQQWALSNDGTFQMEEKQNQYAVYDSPFDTPSQPGRWTVPDGRAGVHGGLSASSQSVQAVSGVDINAASAWSVYDGGSRDVVIALIDTGVDLSHEDLQSVAWVNEDEIAGNGIDDDGNGYIDDVNGWNFYNNSNKLYVSSTDDSHGTHGAGTIAATADNGVGVAGIVQSDHVKIMVLKALGGSDGSGTTESIIQAIRYAEQNGASICNLSLGTSSDDRALYQAMSSSSMLFVVAAGNDGDNTDKTPCYPASYDLDNIISVANLNYDGGLHTTSNYGAKSVDLAAPGSYILSTTPGNSYSYMTGTSMAAPMVTAAAAMVYSYYKDITLADVKDILLSSAKSLTSLSGKTVTGGMLDLGAAMSYDVSTLSGKTWQTGTASSTGSAPQIVVTTVTGRNKTYLKVTVTDVDGDLAATAYAQGSLTAAQFQGGNAGVAFSVGSGGNAYFSASGSGTYTFYAVDRAGHETVETVTIRGKVQRPGMRSADGETGLKAVTAGAVTS